MRLLYPGSFDPPHLGHLDLILRGAALAEHLTVAVAENPDKRPVLPVAVRVDLLRRLCTGRANIAVASYRGATLHFARACGATALLRGLRHAGDLEHERGMAETHRRLGLETVLLAAAGEHVHLSSSLARSAAAAGLPLAGLVPDEVAAALGGAGR